MKLTKYFMPLAAVALLASCSNDKLDGPAENGGVSENPGDMYMSMTINAVSNNGTRTTTPNQGSEVGKDRENNITSALVIFATGSETEGYKIFESVYVGGVSNTSITKQGDNYIANFAVTRDKLLTEIGEGTDASKTFQMFVIANAPIEWKDEYVGGKTKDVQSTFSVEDGDDDSYWKPNNFLMSNSELVSVVIKRADIERGKHVTAGDPYEIGNIINVQRAMCRFDIDTDKLSFSVHQSTVDNPDYNTESPVEGTSPTISHNVAINFDGASLINMATEAYLYKLTGAVTSSFTASSIHFEDEKIDNWVYTPTQSDWALYLYEEGEGPEEGTLFQKDLSTLSYDGFANLEDDNNITPPAEEKNPNYPEWDDTSLTGYQIWRYAMENTNPSTTNTLAAYEASQIHKLSTGVIFRAKMTGKTFLGEDFSNADAIYAYNNFIIGDWAALKAYAEGEEQLGNADWEAISYFYGLAKDAAGDDYDQEVTTPDKKSGERNIDPKLVENGFTIYRPETVQGEKVFYCYYPYWNRHNDNGDNSQIGCMEFSTVRNNIYKLRVNSVVKLGHPADPSDDPDPIDPDDPNESDSFYCSITCKVLDWEVRINNIDF